MEDIKTWYQSFPIVSRSFITACVVVTIISSIIWGDFPHYLYLSREKLMEFQIWRLYSNFFFIGFFGPNIIWTFVFLLESLFTERQVDEQLWLYIFNMTLLSVVGLIFKGFWLSDSLLFSFIYIWCKRKPFETVQFFFGLKFKSGYFPFILMGLHLIMGQSVMNDLYGMGVGHAYIFLKDIYPVSSGKNFLRTPQFFTKFVNKYITKVQPAHNYQNPNNNNANNNNNNNQGNFFRNFQGQGVRIG